GLIAVVAGGPFNPWAYRVIGELEQVAAHHQLGVVIQHHRPSTGSGERIESHLTEGLADAAVVIAASSLGTARLHRIGRRIPLLAMSDEIRPRGFDVMVQHEEAASRLAAEHLIKLGVRRPAFLLHGHSPSRRQPRLEGFVSAFVDHGLDRDSIMIAEDDDQLFAGFLDARHVATRLLDRSRRKRPDAIMAHSDRAAISVIWAATQLGISIPDELKVIGAGNIPEGAALSPALTTVGSEISAFRPLFERLITRIDQPELRTRTLPVPWELIIRQSA
ncbi:MAG TPA: LacI family DNA-binding transcriptional regulator, partial [Microlunatus sp.]